MIPEARDYDKESVAMLSLIKQCDLTKREYRDMHFFLEDTFGLIVPPWDILMKEAKRMCPPLTITETDASYSMEDMVEYTVKRYVKQTNDRMNMPTLFSIDQPASINRIKHETKLYIFISNKAWIRFIVPF